MDQVHEKVVLKYTMTDSGEQCVRIDSRTKRQELSATCSDTGRSLSLRILIQRAFSAIGRLFYINIYVYFSRNRSKP